MNTAYADSLPPLVTIFFGVHKPTTGENSLNNKICDYNNPANALEILYEYLSLIHQLPISYHRPNSSKRQVLELTLFESNRLWRR